MTMLLGDPAKYQAKVSLENEVLNSDNNPVYETQPEDKKNGFFKRTFTGGIAFMTSIACSDAIYTSMMDRKVGEQLAEIGMKYEANPLAQNLLDSFNNPEVALLYQKAPTLAFIVGTAYAIDKLNDDSGLFTKALNKVGIKEGKDLLYAAGAFWSVGVSMNLFNYFYNINFPM